LTNPTDGSLQVRASMRRRQGVFTRAKTKTKRFERRIALAGQVVEALRAYRLRQLTARLEWADVWTDTDVVFCDEVGCELSADRVRWAFKQLLTAAALPAVRFHDLRYTAATLL
ncbi:MAG TPA: hypothetical protein VGR57_13865, partial [Ktedonobacterales bacterium]|nr:hypothetical protein [Ktedonobacterales bacterium]